MYRESQQPRILRRLKFLRKNWKLCKNAFKLFKGESNCHHSDWKTEHGRKLVERAKKKIGYSNSTANCDIYWSLYGLYRWVKDSGLNNTW